MEEIGYQLRAARETKGVTLEVAEEETKIRRKYLEALELGRQADLPGEAYLKGFLRTYGNYLGLDGAALVERFKQSQAAHAHTESPASTLSARGEKETPARRHAAPAEQAESPRVAAVSRLRRTPGEEERQQPPRAERPPRAVRQRPAKLVTPRGVAIAVAVLVVVGGISYLGYLLAGRVGDKAALNQSSAPPASSTKQPDAPPVAATPTNPQPPAQTQPEPAKVTMTKGAGQDVTFTVAAKEVQVTLEPSSQRLWMSVQVDGKMVHDSLFPTQPVEFKGREITLRMGHMNDVSLVVNGTRFDKPLQNGPYTLIFKAQ